jgi:hypothetical protein
LKAQHLTKLEREQFDLPDNLKEIVVGLLLGALHAEKRSINTRFKFEQGKIHDESIYHLYELFKEYCSAVPNVVNRLPHRLTGSIYSIISFNTYSLPCFNYYHSLFYQAGRKKVPNNIKELLTPRRSQTWRALVRNFCIFDAKLLFFYGPTVLKKNRST